MKELTQRGVGIHIKQAQPISENDEAALWESGQFGDGSPKALLNTV